MSDINNKKATSEISDAHNNKLTNGNVWKILLLYSLPLFGSAFVQQLYSLVDLLVVGNFAENGALAVDAIGNATVFVNILLAFAFGANNGCSVIIAKYSGKGDNKSLLETVSTAVISYSVLCLGIMILGFALGRVALIGLGVHSLYFSDCLTYLYIYIGSMPFVFLYNLGCGICAALGDSKTPFIFLVVSSALNVGLDLLFVWCLHLGVAGAAWATFISQAISCALTVVVVYKKIRAVKPDAAPRRFNKRIFRELTVASVPVIMQQSFVYVRNFFVNKSINGLDETGDAITGFTTAFKLLTMATMSMVSMSGGLTNFASQNKAASKPDRAKKGFWVIMLYTIAVALLFLILFVCFPEFFTRLFVQKEKLTPDALAYAVKFLSLVSLFLPIVGIKIVADGMVRGCGGNLGFAVSTFSDLILRVALVYALIAAGMGFDGVCWAWAIGWAIGTIIAVAFCIATFKKLDRPRKNVRQRPPETDTADNAA